MGILVTRTNDLKGMNPPAAPATASGSLATFRKAGSSQASQDHAEEILNLPQTHRLDFCGIDAREAGAVIPFYPPQLQMWGTPQLACLRGRGGRPVHGQQLLSDQVAAETPGSEDASMWIPRGWKHLGTGLNYQKE